MDIIQYIRNYNKTIRRNKAILEHREGIMEPIQLYCLDCTTKLDMSDEDQVESGRCIQCIQKVDFEELRHPDDNEKARRRRNE